MKDSKDVKVLERIAKTESPINIDLETQNTFSVYPNPTHDMINISIAKDIENWVAYEIYDLLGKLRSQSALSSLQVSIDVSELPSGIFIIRLLGEDGNDSVTKFTKL